MAKDVKLWNKIKAEYLQGATPKDLAKKYSLMPRQISDKANKEKWVAEKAKICEKVREITEDRILELSNLALDTLEALIKGSEAEDSIKVSACKSLIDISGLKSSKTENTIINTEPIKIEIVK